MARILLQTTIRKSNEDWHVARFGMLADLLRSEGHDVVARDPQPLPDGSDPVLSSLADSNFDQLWLIAADSGNGLAPGDVRGILRFRERGGAVLSARDRSDVGASLLNLGGIGAVNNFSTYNRPRSPYSRTPSVPEASYRRIVPLEPVHDTLRSENSPTGVIEYLPALPHEGTLSVPEHVEFARVIAISDGGEPENSLNVAVAIENEPCGNSYPSGRAFAVSTFHHFSDAGWNRLGGDPPRMEMFKDYVRNIARWLTPRTALL